MNKTLEVKEALIQETAARKALHVQATKLSQQVERVFEDLKAAKTFDDLEVRLNKHTTMIDVIDLPK